MDFSYRVAQIDLVRVPLDCSNNDGMGAPALCNRFHFDFPDCGKFLECMIILIFFKLFIKLQPTVTSYVIAITIITRKRELKSLQKDLHPW